MPNYLGGLTIAAGDLAGNRVPEIIVGAGITGNTSNPLSGQFRVFEGETLPLDEGNTALQPLYLVEAFSGTEQVSVTTLDDDLSGRIDRILAAPSAETGLQNQRLKSFSADGVPDFNDVLSSDTNLLKYGVDVG